jgi:hypothetical protein
MSTMLVILLILGGVAYLVYTIVTYFRSSADLSRTLEEALLRVERTTERLSDYEARVDALKEGLPQQRRRCERLKQWVEQLRAQKSRLGSEAAPRAFKNGTGRRATDGGADGAPRNSGA